jgi:hypothetical protein
MHTPQVSSPFISAMDPVIGSKEILSTFSEIVPDEKRLSVTVGIVDSMSGVKVPI